ncbi:sigma-54-dependent transcriptional regulator [Sphingopyxis alaskensis]|jgi:two-component system, NtrC family, nitrogen regulation response regulator GlnG|uniref:DNA-binding transcriptional regulator NtrC n=1 Tax=Sphingopyxis alaskensis (strain DSM 13593 / LMG 18877 / RB2256) TaxID=317655 RepID=Q1GTN3_SPHAL|nr:sigma-54 dependent transcriptional regulator [Sphingopyxis alaskensis]ABF52989.1 two component, sigma54 specific, transcriptional regulator, Fis family [Sphingopyxis alaskensis RB2256]MCM3420123.1 sigma-54 dependent transcriptional regulator [Sphingopyxis alaskensis]
MSEGKTILLVEDDPAIAMVIRETLDGECGLLASVGSIAERNAWLAAHRADLIITDVVLPDGDGIDSLVHAGVDPATPVIVLSAQNTLDTAVRATGIGSYDYLPKPFDLDELTASVRAALQRRVEAAASDAPPPADSHGLVGRAPAMQAVYRTIARLATNDLAVLILGESGTGKEVVARAIHATGLRRDGPFVAINMAAIPRELIEAELFGHEKGAFTGAHSRNAGRFEQAAGGTLFLDEIGDMPLEAQTRLLRVLQSNEYSTVGGSQALRADVRVIAATHRDMRTLVADGRFREDLFYRLNVIPVTLPPLRDRRSDIAALVRHFVEVGRGSGLPDRQFAPEAMQWLERHDWPGNVRELGNVVQRLAVLSRDTVVTAREVEMVLRDNDESGGVADPAALIARAVDDWAREKMASAEPDGGIHGQLEAIVEAALFRRVLRDVRGNQLEAARRLGINRNTLRKRLAQLEIDPLHP